MLKTVLGSQLEKEKEVKGEIKLWEVILIG
jgi:hypothetical protein